MTGRSRFFFQAQCFSPLASYLQRPNDTTQIIGMQLCRTERIRLLQQSVHSLISFFLRQRFHLLTKRSVFSHFAKHIAFQKSLHIKPSAAS